MWKLSLVLTVTMSQLVACNLGMQDHVLSGHYQSLTEYGSIKLDLSGNGEMREEMRPLHGKPIDLTGTWKEGTGGLLLTPSLSWDPAHEGAPLKLYDQILNLDHDAKGHLQLVISDDFGWWFQKM